MEIFLNNLIIDLTYSLNRTDISEILVHPTKWRTDGRHF